ncbi:hypothetical protein FRC01_007055 [Tulasnella sp. 417]|nr:hypothetical protein FRC01_007055 [Tulasnella sp. 417]
MKFRSITLICLQDETTDEDITELRRLCVELYYQFDPDRLAFCISTIHAILHIPDDIVNSGPVWTSWCFAMERICFLVKTCVTSRLHLYGTIDQRIKRDAQLSTIKLRYTLTNHLNFSLQTVSSQNEEIRRTETWYEEYNAISLEDPESALRSPRLDDFQLEDQDYRRLLGYLYGFYGASSTQSRKIILARTPKNFIRWAKKHRDSSYIRFELLKDRNEEYTTRPIIWERTVYYGQLHYLIDFVMPTIIFDKKRHKERRHVLAFVTPCNTNGSDATKALTAYSDSPAGRSPSRFIDLNCVECAVGRIKSRNAWFIVDRSGGLARTSFIDEPDSDGEA